MHRRDRIGSGTSVSSVVSSFSKKSQEASKETLPSKLPRAPRPTRESFSGTTKSGRDKDSVTSTASFSFKSRDHAGLNGSTGSRSEASSVSSRRESTTSSVSSVDGEPNSPGTNHSQPTIVGSLICGKVASPKVKDTG